MARDCIEAPAPDSLVSAPEPLAEPLALEALQPQTFQAENLEPENLQLEKWMLGEMAGRSLAMQQLFTRMRCTAPHFRLVAVEGESGTGKLLAAQTLHRLGNASAGPFVPALAADFLAAPQSLWKEAAGGLIYLSRVDELTAPQQRLLRDFLERAAHERLRSLSLPGPRQVVAGASQSLRRLAATGAFRSDLASHLTAIRFFLPPLRDRREDLPLLAGLFLRQCGPHHAKPLRGFAPGSLSRLAAHAWPGNVRELQSVISSAALECPGQWIRPIDLPRLQWPAAISASSPAELPLDDPNLDRAILRHITRVLAHANGNKVHASRMLGISRSTLYRLLDSANSLQPASQELPLS
ncbi:MAG: sigma 54-interacting transcriptional regulator [Acidobacteriaceae bacterium]